MSQKQLDDAVKKLVQLGYTKSKSQKAMKECGNNFAKAKTWLEKTKEEEDRKAHEVELAAKAKAHAEKQKKEQQDRREREALMDQNPGDDVTEKTRRHPCVAQYGSCRYGASCMFKELPWDTCINYVLGTCLYGDQCRNRHAINGQDIRKMIYGNRDTEHEYIRLENGNYVQVNRQGKVQEGELWVPEYTPEVIAAPIPEPSAFAGGEGSVPTYSEPLHHLQQQQQQQHMFQQHHHTAGGVGGVTLADDLWGSAAASSNNIPKSPGAAAANGDSGVLGYTLRPNAVNTPQGSPNAPTPFLQKARIGQHVAQPALKPVTPMSMMPTPPPPDPRGPAGRAHP